MSRPVWDPGEKPAYAFCESVPLGPWHIRKVGGAGLKLGGGIDTPSLCERVRPMGDNSGTIKGLGGWDLNVRISEHHLSHCCRSCADIYRKVQT